MFYLGLGFVVFSIFELVLLLVTFVQLDESEQSISSASPVPGTS